MADIITFLIGIPIFYIMRKKDAVKYQLEAKKALD